MCTLSTRKILEEAILIFEGPLNGASEKEIRSMSERVLLMVEKGL
jgi:hypothetical protein